MTLKEAVQFFDHVLPIDSAWLVIHGERVGVPYCCDIPVTENSQNGVARIFCGLCKREIRQVGQQWIVSNWGHRGIKMPEINADGPAARREETEIERRIEEAVLAEREACARIAEECSNMPVDGIQVYRNGWYHAASRIARRIQARGNL
jgi:hypothetical protein